MNRSRRPHASSNRPYRLLCVAIIAAIALSGFATRGWTARAEALAPSPFLTNASDATSPDVFTVTGEGFTPKGKVYLAIYDQMGQQLYEHRWVTASRPVSSYEAGILNNRGSQDAVPSPGGALHESFRDLCGASALIRGYDYSTELWSNWLVVQPACTGAVSSTVANDLLRPTSLPMTVLDPAAPTVANDLDASPAPVLVGADSADKDPGTLTVSGEGFTGGGRVYVAIYDQMGAKLYETRWTAASPMVAITGPRADVPEANPIPKTSGGELRETFAGLCGAQVLIRAYDQRTAIWSNWLEAAPLCPQPRGYGPH